MSEREQLLRELGWSEKLIEAVTAPQPQLGYTPVSTNFAPSSSSFAATSLIVDARGAGSGSTGELIVAAPVKGSEKAGRR